MTTHILFDFFGTLVEYSASRIEQGYRRSFDVLRSAGSPLDYDAFLSLWSEVSADFDEVANRTNREFSMLDVGHAFLERAAVSSPSDTVNEFVSAYIAEWNTGVHAIDGLSDLLASLGRQYALSVITNTHDPKLVPDHLRQMGIATHFDRVITSVEFGLRKPSAEIFEHALGLLETTAAQCLYVGDNYEADYLGAHSAGIRCLLIDPRREAPIQAVDRLDSILDLARILDIAPAHGDTVSIRPFEAGDQEQARNLVLTGLGEHFGFIDESLNPDLDDIEAAYEEHGHVFLVAELKNSIVGTAGLLFESMDSARIVRMSARKDMRRHGVATALLRALIDETRARSIDAIHAHTEPHWTGSMAFYRNTGFVQIGADEVDVHLRLELGRRS